MTNVNITEDTYQVTVTEGVTQVVTVKAPGPQGTFIDGDLGDVTVSSNGANIVVNAGAIDNANIASNAAIDLTKLATGALPTAITVTSANISDLSIVNADINASAAIQGTKISPNFGSQDIVTTGPIYGKDLVLIDTSPAITFTDSDNNPDFRLKVDAGSLQIIDVTNSNVNRLVVNADGHVDVLGNLDVGAGLDVTGAITSTGNLTISNSAPKLNFTDTGHNPDYSLNNFNGQFSIKDETSGDIRFAIHTDGHIDITSHTDFGAGIDVTGDLTVSGNMTVSGTTTTIDTTTLTVEDKNIELGKVSTPTDTTADQGGITLLGATNKTFQWLDATDSWTSSEHIALPDQKKLKLGNSQDYLIHHNGSSSFVHTETGNLSLSSPNKVQLSNATGDGTANYENMVQAIANGAVELFYDNSKKLETSSNGINVYNSGLVFQTTASGTNTFGNIQIPNDTGKIKLGASQDLEIFHDGTVSRIKDVGTGNLVLQSGTVILMNPAGSEQMARFHEDGSCELRFDHVAKLETTSTGATVTGSLTVSSTTPEIFFTDTNNNSDFKAYVENGTFHIMDVTSTENRFRIESDGDFDLKGNVRIPLDNKKLTLGASADLELYHDGSNSHIKNATGHLIFKSDNFQFKDKESGDEMVKMLHDGAVELYFDNSKKLETTTNGVKLIGAQHDIQGVVKFDNMDNSGLDLRWEPSSNSLDFTDNVKARFGSDQDLQIYHDGSNSFIDESNGVGSLYVRTNAFQIQKGAGVETMAQFLSDGAVNLYYDNSKKFETQTNGARIYDSLGIGVNSTSGALLYLKTPDGSSGNNTTKKGIIIRDGAFSDGQLIDCQDSLGNRFFSVSGDLNVNLTDNHKLQLGNSQDLQIYHDGTNSVIRDDGSGSFSIQSNGTEIALYNHSNSEYMGRFINNGAVEFYHNGSKKFETTSNGNKSTGTFEFLHSTGAARAKITADGNYKNEDGVKFISGTSNDLQIYHDASNSIIDNNTGTLFVQADTITFTGQGNSENLAKFIKNADVKLYYNNSEKFKTLSTGVDVAGRIFGDTMSLGGTGTAYDALFQFSHNTAYSASGTNAKVAIGNANSSAATNSTGIHMFTDGNGRGIVNLNACNNSTNASADFVVQTRHSGTLGERLRITSNGNVGIGTTSPTSKLEVTGAITGTADATIHGQTVGRGGGGIAYNVALGQNTFNSNTTGQFQTAVGSTAGFSLTSGSHNVALGHAALANATTGSHNTALGTGAIRNANGSNNVGIGSDACKGVSGSTGNNNIGIGRTSLLSFTTGGANVAIGYASLDANTTGSNNIGIGYNALTANTTANNNTAVGLVALGANTTGIVNVAVGNYALDANTIGGSNTAVGYGSLSANTTASNNSGFGKNALMSNTTAANNTAVGYESLKANTTGSVNVGVGVNTLLVNTTGEANTAVGTSALGSNISGDNNTALGRSALVNNTASNNTAIGKDALKLNTTGGPNVAIGANALDANTTGPFNIAVGYQALTANTTGDQNVGIGDNALADCTTGHKNVGVGTHNQNNLTTGLRNTSIGNYAMGNGIITGQNNVAVGDNTASRLTSGSLNVAVGPTSLFEITTGSSNVAVGFDALRNNATADYNTAVGRDALKLNTTGNLNVAIGSNALDANQVGDRAVAVGFNALTSQAPTSNTDTYNVAIGVNALFLTTTGTANASVGGKSLESNTTGTNNVGIGTYSLQSNTTANNNTAVGHVSNQSNTTGANNTSVGAYSLQSNTTGAANTAVGKNSSQSTTTGSNNTTLGNSSLYTNTTGGNNVACGIFAMYYNTTGDLCTAIGRDALVNNTTGGGNVGVGYNAGNNITTGTNNLVLGQQSTATSATVHNEITLGNSSNTTLRCNTQTISSLSDARDKTNVIDLPEGLDFITKLRPVKFEWATRDGNGKDGSFEHGFIAQDLQTAQKENDADYLNMVMDENPDRLEASYGKLVPILVKAIQELTMEVNKLKSNG